MDSGTDSRYDNAINLPPPETDAEWGEMIDDLFANSRETRSSGEKPPHWKRMYFGQAAVQK